MNFDELYEFYVNEASDNLHQWFKRGGKDCNKIKGKMYQKKSSKRVTWKKKDK